LRALLTVRGEAGRGELFGHADERARLRYPLGSKPLIPMKLKIVRTHALETGDAWGQRTHTQSRPKP
jgi:hypothetical protein